MERVVDSRHQISEQVVPVADSKSKQVGVVDLKTNIAYVFVRRMNEVLKTSPYTRPPILKFGPLASEKQVLESQPLKYKK